MICRVLKFFVNLIFMVWFIVMVVGMLVVFVICVRCCVCFVLIVWMCCVCWWSVLSDWWILIFFVICGRVLFGCCVFIWWKF